MSYTLSTNQDQTMFQPIPMKADTTPKFGEQGDPALTLRARENGGGFNDMVAQPNGDEYVVRRLTPMECERLQGFPDGWTDLGNTPDSRRYKQMGNSMAVPVMRMIGRRIEAFDILHGDEVGMPPHAEVR